MRTAEGGTKAYHHGTVSNYGHANIHDHSDHRWTCGMGEVEAVINGVEFQTRHNDFSLIQPSTESSDWHAKQYIESPGVPPSVTSAGSVEGQVAEMKEYFRAFATQNVSHRDYRPFFRPTLAYMEGVWRNVRDTVTDPFFSDRHSIEAETWEQVHETIRFLSNSGVKNAGENMWFLPQAVRDMDGHRPEFGQCKGL